MNSRNKSNVLVKLTSGSEIEISRQVLMLIQQIKEMYRTGIFKENDDEIEYYDHFAYPDEIVEILKHLCVSKGPADAYVEPIHPETLDDLQNLGFKDPVSIVKFKAWRSGDTFMPSFIGTVREYIKHLCTNNVHINYTIDNRRWQIELGSYTEAFCKANSLKFELHKCVELSERRFKFIGGNSDKRQPSKYLLNLAQQYPAKNKWARDLLTTSNTPNKFC